MSILNITNLTENPEKWIEDKFMDAFEELEKELGIEIDTLDKHNYIDREIELLVEQAEDTKGRDLMYLIDNYLVNLDYYSQVKEWYESTQQ